MGSSSELSCVSEYKFVTQPRDRVAPDPTNDVEIFEQDEESRGGQFDSKSV